MAYSNEWKTKLISSSLPLEFEVAQILVSKHFTITADYKYERIDLHDSENAKDFSVDLCAKLDLSTGRQFKGRNTELQLLVECKQKKSDNKWIFFPDPNPYSSSEISSRGYVVQYIDEFSKHFFPIQATKKIVSFSEKNLICYKGTEINLSTGSVFDKEIKHGLSQLQYALPRLMTQNIIESILFIQWMKSSRPFLYCPILVTTADLFIVNKNLKITNIESADSLNQIAVQVPYLVVSLDYGPDFENHCIKECKKLTKPHIISFLKELGQIRYENGEYYNNVPIRIYKELLNAGTATLERYFTQFIVCSMKNFPALLDEIKEICQSAESQISDKDDFGLRQRNEDIK